jgi:hypothetical protein
MTKLLPILLLSLLVTTSLFAKDTQSATVHRHGDAVVFILLPNFYSGDSYQIVCSGSYSATRETGYDCRPAIPQPIPKELQKDITGGTVDSIRINVPESMY